MKKDMYWDMLFPFIERALGFKLYVWQKRYIKGEKWTLRGRGLGFTTAYCIKQLVALNKEMVKRKEVYKLQDGYHGIRYSSWFERYFLDMHDRLRSAGVPVVVINS